MFIYHYTIIEELGRGISATVYRVEDKEARQLALKVYDRRNCTAMNNFDDEVCAYSSLGQHENTVKLVESKKVAIQESGSRWKEVDYIALELATKGDLFDYV